MRPILFSLALAALIQSPQKQPSASKGQQNTRGYQRGSDTLPVVVKVLPTPQSAEEAAEQAARVDRDESTQRWNKGGLVASVLLTLGLLVVSFRQWRTAQAQQRTADQQRVVMELQSQIMGNTVATMDRQREIMDRQTALMRDQFDATFRPKLMLRRIIQRPKNNDVTIEIANAGGIGVANAELRVWFGVFATANPVPADAMEGLAAAIPVGTSIPHGGSVVILVPTLDPSPFERSDVRNGTQTVYCFGYIEYRGEGATLHRTGFVRRHDAGPRWWVRADFPDADFEYTD